MVSAAIRGCCVSWKSLTAVSNRTTFTCWPVALLTALTSRSMGERFDGSVSLFLGVLGIAMCYTTAITLRSLTLGTIVPLLLNMTILMEYLVNGTANCCSALLYPVFAADGLG